MGRSGRDGLAVSLVSGGEHNLFENIRKLVKSAIPTESLDGSEPTEQPARNSQPQKKQGRAPRSNNNSRARSSRGRNSSSGGGRGRSRTSRAA